MLIIDMNDEILKDILDSQRKTELCVEFFSYLSAILIESANFLRGVTINISKHFVEVDNVLIEQILWKVDKGKSWINSCKVKIF